ncbi:MAG: sulfotransferase domain-containing protein [Candidatus Reddybacter sp.]
MNNKNSLPRFIVIGAMKCGTTSLWDYLKQHPNINVPSNIKNINFFDSKSNWDKGLSFYKEHFSPQNDLQISGEISTEYTKYPYVKDVAKNIYNTLPRVRFIYLIRNPIDRLISHYIHNVGAARENRDINEALHEKNNNPYILFSQYYFQLSIFLKYFDNKQFLIITTDGLKTDRDNTLATITSFIEAEPNNTPWVDANLHTRQSKLSWNKLGRIVRKSQKYYNYYNYYLSKLPHNQRSLIEGLLSHPIETPIINRENFEYLSDVFSHDLQQLESQMHIKLPDWNLSFAGDIK